MRHPRLLLPILLLLTLLQGLSPLLHAHRDAPLFEGALHIHAAFHGAAAPVSLEAGNPADAGWQRASWTPAEGAIVTPVDEFKRRALLAVPTEVCARPVPPPGQSLSAVLRPPSDAEPIAVPHRAHRSPPAHAPPQG